ncbi:hypothetical protein SteCoe_24477 [Stentor coeruleus]|uniref:Uncharacterized protein n=1 Tax=Stentor coeruleus TaxID=5963 RepID=A0A1R2BHD9_9CILI|nr:hypothetical protein SteCoe_24477 [Stentor coeruleus]
MQNILDFNSISEIIKRTINLYFENALPNNEPLIISSELLIYAARTTAESLTSSNIQINGNVLEIPGTIQLESDTIYDTEYIIYPTINNEVKFEVSFYTSGTYLDYKLSITQQTSVNLNSEPIYVALQGNFSENKNYECSYLKSDKIWTVNGCEIEKSSKNEIKISLLHQSTFKVYEIPSTKTCKPGYGPIITSCAWILITIFAITIFYIIDKNQEEDFQNSNKYTIYAFTSIFISQSKTRRIWSMIYLFSIHMLFMFLIGICLLNFTTPQLKSDKNFKHLPNESINSGILAWFLTQIFAFPNYYCIFNKYVSIKKTNFAIYTSLSLSIVSIVGIIFMTTIYCNVYSYYWIISYFVFLPLQIVVEILFAVIVWKRQKNTMDIQSANVIPEVAELCKSRIDGEEFKDFDKSTKFQEGVVLEEFKGFEKSTKFQEGVVVEGLQNSGFCQVLDLN